MSGEREHDANSGLWTTAPRRTVIKSAGGLALGSLGLGKRAQVDATPSTQEATPAGPVGERGQPNILYTSPALTLPNPHLINLTVDPKERKSLDYPYVHTWVETHVYHMLTDFRASVEKEPLIPLGAPLDYVPSRGGA